MGNGFIFPYLWQEMPTGMTRRKTCSRAMVVPVQAVRTLKWGGKSPR